MIKRTAPALICVIFILAFAGCAPTNNQTPKKSTFFAMDTVMQATVYGDAELLKKAEQIVLSLEKKLSVTDSDSEIYKLNHGITALVSDETADIVSRSLDICKKTGGALDISVYPLVSAWGFTTGNYRVPSPEELAEITGRVGYDKISVTGNEIALPDGMMIDLGAVAKGYAADMIIDCFREGGAESAVISLGGNVQTIGTKPDGSMWRVAIASPDGDGYACVVSVSDSAVVTSGGYERYFETDGERYIHIIDPKTGYPVSNNIASVSVIGKSGFLCDALSTAIFVCGIEGLGNIQNEIDGFDVIIITKDGKFFITEGIERSFETFGSYKNAEVNVIRHD